MYIYIYICMKQHGHSVQYGVLSIYTYSMQTTSPNINTLYNMRFYIIVLYHSVARYIVDYHKLVCYDISLCCNWYRRVYNVYAYIYTPYICIIIYIERDIDTYICACLNVWVYGMCVCIYTYIYIYIYMYRSGAWSARAGRAPPPAWSTSRGPRTESW